MLMGIYRICLYYSTTVNCNLLILACCLSGVLFQKISIPPRQKELEFPGKRDGGSAKPNKLKKCMKLYNWNFPRRWGS